MLKEGQDQSPRPRDDEGHNQLWKTRLISSDSIFFFLKYTFTFAKSYSQSNG